MALHSRRWVGVGGAAHGAALGVHVVQVAQWLHRSMHVPTCIPVPAPQDTGDTRETPAIDVCRGLMADGARVCVYDPQVEDSQIYQVRSSQGRVRVADAGHLLLACKRCLSEPSTGWKVWLLPPLPQDLGTAKFEWDHPTPKSAPVSKDVITISHVSAALGMPRQS